MDIMITYLIVDYRMGLSDVYVGLSAFDIIIWNLFWDVFNNRIRQEF